MSEENTTVPPPEEPPPPRSWSDRALDGIEWAGNKLPDPVVLFLIALVLTWAASVLLAPVEFTEIDPRTLGQTSADGTPQPPKPIQIQNQLEGQTFVGFLAKMVHTFISFPPLGLVLVVLLGVGVAEHTGFVKAGLKALLSVTPDRLLTPMTILVGILSHAAADSGYVVVIPLGGVIFYAAGRHPLAGIAAAFAAVSGGLSANFIPIMLDPLLQKFTQPAAQMLAPGHQVHILCNYFFTSISSLLVISLGWYITDRIVEPRLARTPVDGDPQDMPQLEPLTPTEWRGLWAALASVLLGAVILVLTVWPAGSPWRNDQGSLGASNAPLVEGIVPLMFLAFLIPGMVYGYVAGTIHGHREIILGMSKSMGTMNYYLVLAFVAAQFIYVFNASGIGVLIAIKGGNWLREMNMPPGVSVIGIVLLTAGFNLLIGSASTKWAALAYIFVPMLMQLNLSPDLTQAAFRIGDSCTNIISPLMPYFPLVVVFCQKYVKSTGIGTLVSLMLPYSVIFTICWTALLLLWWGLGMPLGVDASYTYP